MPAESQPGESKLDKLSRNTVLRDRLYLIGFTIIVIAGILYNSTFRDLIGAFNLEMIQTAASLLIIAKILIFGIRNKYELAASMLVILLSRFLYVTASEPRCFPAMVCVMGAYGIRLDKIAKTYLYTALPLLAAIIICSQVGIVEDLCYESANPFWIFHIRHSFGILYTTDFAAYVFYILLSFFVAYQKFDRFFYLRALVPIVVAPVIYCLCITRLDCICILLLGIGMIFVGVINRFQEHSVGFAAVLRKCCEQFCIWSMPVFAAVIYVLTLAYSKNSALLSKLDRILNTRLAQGKKGFTDYSVTLFGQIVPMHGMGGTVTHDFANDPYFYLDSSYVNCLLRLGLVFTILMLVIFVIIGLRYRKNHIILLCSALVALNCMIAHHLPDISYNFFMIALLAEGGLPIAEIFRCKKFSAQSSREK